MWSTKRWLRTCATLPRWALTLIRTCCFILLFFLMSSRRFLSEKKSAEFITIDSQSILTSMTFEIPLLTFFRCPSFEGHALGSFPGPWEWKNANRSDGGRFQEKVLRFPWNLWEKHLSNVIWMSFDSSNPLFRQIFVRVFEGFICKCSFFNLCI